MTDYYCVHGHNVSKYKCPKCEAGILLRKAQEK